MTRPFSCVEVGYLLRRTRLVNSSDDLLSASRQEKTLQQQNTVYQQTINECILVLVLKTNSYCLNYYTSKMEDLSVNV